MNLFIGLFILVLAGGAERASAHQVHGRPSFPLGALFHPHDPHGHHRAKNTAKLAEEFNARRPRVGVTRWDLRSANGRNSVTPLRSQGICGTCVAFSAISSLESTLLYRGALPNSATADLSEQFLHYCLGQRLCDSGWWVDSAHVAAAGGGAFDESCLPYSLTAGCGKVLCGTSKNYFMNGSLVLKAVELESWDQMKAHIANYGAITLAFNIYSDFPGFPDSKFTTFPDTYVWPGSKTQKIVGGHAVSCYGFDDDMPNNQTATSRGVLFCKNSWGTTWGALGHFKIAYGADGIMNPGLDSYGFQVLSAAPRSTMKKIRSTTKKVKKTTKKIAKKTTTKRLVRTTKRVVKTVKRV